MVVTTIKAKNLQKLFLSLAIPGPEVKPQMSPFPWECKRGRWGPVWSVGGWWGRVGIWVLGETGGRGERWCGDGCG